MFQNSSLWTAVLLLFLAAGAYGQEPTLVIENARVIVGNDVVKDAATVVIAGNRIQQVSTESPQAGLAPERILRAGTRDAAEHLGLLKDLGTVEPGKIADLILIAGDPLKDISCVRNVQMVVKEGQIVHNADGEVAVPKGVPSDANPVGWFEIPVTDLPRAQGFYEHVLDVKLQPLRFGPLEMAVFPTRPGTPGATGALMRGEAFQPSQGGVQIYFTTPDVDGTLERVRERGGKVVLPKTPLGPFGFIASFEDSEGNRIGLRSRP